MKVRKENYENISFGEILFKVNKHVRQMHYMALICQNKKHIIFSCFHLCILFYNKSLIYVFMFNSYFPLEVTLLTSSYCFVNPLIVLIFAILSHSEISSALRRHT